MAKRSRIVEIKTGQIVEAVAGRDKGQYFVVLNFLESSIQIVNGKERKLKKPKTKGLKHIKLTNTAIDMNSITDKKLRNVLSEYSKKAKVTSVLYRAGGKENV